MAEYRIQGSTLDAIADAINAKTGGSSAMTPAQMVTAIGSIPSGGGGSLPPVISKIDGGSFTLASNTDCRTYDISHSLGVVPKAFVIWTEDIAIGEAQSAICLVRIHYFDTPYNTTTVSTGIAMRIGANGSTVVGGVGIVASAVSSWVTASKICASYNTNYKAGCTYQWLAWA